jgi:hypothetical protein
VETDKPGGAMESLSLRFVDPVLEDRFQRHGGREGHAAFLVTAGASAVPHSLPPAAHGEAADGHKLEG